MTQKELNKILHILERRKEDAEDHWLKATKYHFESEPYWLGQFIGLDLAKAEIEELMIMEGTDND